MKPASRVQVLTDLQGGDDRCQFGLTFYELYISRNATARGPADPISRRKPSARGMMFCLICICSKRPEGWKPPPGVTFEWVAGMSKGPRHWAPVDAPACTQDTIDYGIVVRGDDAERRWTEGASAPGVQQNGTCHRWQPAGPCLWPSSRLAASAAAPGHLQECNPTLNLSNTSADCHPDRGRTACDGRRAGRWAARAD